jgi:hypothetical protein
MSVLPSLRSGHVQAAPACPKSANRRSAKRSSLRGMVRSRGWERFSRFGSGWAYFSRLNRRPRGRPSLSSCRWKSPIATAACRRSRAPGAEKTGAPDCWRKLFQILGVSLTLLSAPNWQAVDAILGTCLCRATLLAPPLMYVPLRAFCNGSH